MGVAHAAADGLAGVGSDDQPGVTTSDGLELWGGVECTVNRVGDQWFSQIERSGHEHRLEDLDRFAGLGIRAIRYPVLWERTAPDPQGEPDWRWPDARLGRLRELGIEPIVGLVHHGSGPSHTSLVDPAFPEKLAAYAAQVARRYPWVTRFTPVNEPLTTARFSGLYGAWYPHGRDEHTFLAALLNQCRGVVLAMRAIREAIPSAQLVQTDDLGKTYSVPTLAYQAEFNNHLRWLCWDLLTGRVDRDHPLWDWLTGRCGGDAQALLWFRDNPCPPDVLGVNYYITSERFLDTRLDVYPVRSHGGNHLERYADIESARCVDGATEGIEGLLLECWQRYRIPIAVTEAHIDATRDDQLRWLVRIWRAAEAARKAGADLRAVTVWALLGSYDWNCLVTECRGYYEPGPFDVRGPEPRPTALARLMRELAAGRVPELPAMTGPGWWDRPGRFLARPVLLDGTPAAQATTSTAAFDAAAALADPTLAGAQDAPSRRPLLITGATGTLGRAFARLCAERGLAWRLVGRNELDIADAGSIERALQRIQPWGVINTAGYVRVDDAETDIERCRRENTIGAELMAAACARHGVPLVTFSTDLVFDGNRDAPYVEADPTAPLNVYGRTKAEAEQRVLERHSKALVVRTSAFFGPWDSYNYLSVVLRTLRDGGRFAAASDLTVSPTYVPDLVHACLDLLVDGESGIWHLTNVGSITGADLAVRAAQMAGLDADQIEPCLYASLPFIARRPAYSALGTGRSAVMPSLDAALDRYFHHYHAADGGAGSGRH
jgi:dTDP-4-dehydrorhamnose reductase